MPSLFASYLRVYEPLAAFDRDAQRYWRRYLREGRAVTVREGPVRQRTAVLEALGSGWTRFPDLPEEAYALEVGGATLICPWSLRFRVAEAALTARDGVPAVIADAFVPPAFAQLARQVVDDRQIEPSRQHEQVATWGVPLRWFVFFTGDEREISTERPRQLRYRTDMSKARRRAHRTLGILRRSVGEVPITEAVADSARWLEQFHPASVVELDYGGLAELLPPAQLIADDSPHLAAVGLAALASGDTEAASTAYETLVTRWRAVQLLERAN